MIFTIAFFSFIKPVALLFFSAGSALWFRPRDQRAFRRATTVGLIVLAFLICEIGAHFSPTLNAITFMPMAFIGMIGEIIVWICMMRIWYLHGLSTTNVQEIKAVANVQAIKAVADEKPITSISRILFWIAATGFAVLVAMILLGLLFYVTRGLH